MKAINASVALLRQSEGMDGVKKQIERAGRTAYKSVNKIHDGSADRFVEMLKEKRHNAVFEHGTIYLCTTSKSVSLKYMNNPYSIVCGGNQIQDNRKYITTNYRVIVENGWDDDLQYLCEPTQLHERRYTLSFITSRAIANEFVRHRHFSFVQESTRWCNYSKGRFGGQIECVIPTAIKPNTVQYLQWKKAMRYAEHWYMELSESKVKPEIARDLLPLGMKTELVMTGTRTEWNNFFELRCANDAHPDARFLAEKAKEIIYEEEEQYDAES
ncbi:FAD-dependent thymidylate synthase [Hoylesella buccalis]|uniref:FAD-dependent thymidylate synthase n=1 Tax=Hoylesella buccalis TaxID=28127 RepID=UPI001D14E567|nr:FAD-dependent thymidylate synthase [Hoylesella buccalis]UEA62995.1 FAD-dependent thymidylate synthase [Hoylesella buccalis]UWP49717.1 FAD-dependent thymidylate synthase [Hoylesella buccalis ATCC 35310]